MPTMPTMQRRQLLHIVFLSCLAFPGHAENVIKLVSSDYPPYFGASLPNGGAVINIVVQAFRHSDYQVQVQYLPWARAISEVRDGNFDGMVAIPYSKEEEAKLAFSSPIHTAQLGFYKQRDRTIEIKEINDLKLFRIGTVRGVSNPVEFNAARPPSFESLDDATNLRKLAIGRLDLVLTDKLVGKYLLENRLTDMRIALNWQGFQLTSNSQHVVFSRKRINFDKKLAAFNEGLRIMAQDGSLKELLHQAGIE
jgi:polar amino acid transport system substrate-binding protein